MKTLLHMLILSSFFFSNEASCNNVEIPNFTSNVVDQAGILSPSQIETINEALEQAKLESSIWGAVFIIDSLKGESIENVADKTFQKWQLGNRELDNGLLLVLAMEERKSRFEVGYGLEGNITDTKSKSILETVLRKHMREGEVDKAIIESFHAAMDSSFSANTFADDEKSELFPYRRFPPYLVFLFCIWFIPMIAKNKKRRMVTKLKNHHPELFQNQHSKHVLRVTKRASIPIRLFLTLNPGIFIIVLSGFSIIIGVISILACGLFSYLYLRKACINCRSAQDFKNALAKQEKYWYEMQAKGYAEQDKSGEFNYTPAYHKYKNSRSSRSSRGFSSSSGGGSSGGGGASSSW